MDAGNDTLRIANEISAHAPSSSTTTIVPSLKAASARAMSSECWSAPSGSSKRCKRCTRDIGWLVWNRWRSGDATTTNGETRAALVQQAQTVLSEATSLFDKGYRRVLQLRQVLDHRVRDRDPRLGGDRRRTLHALRFAAGQGADEDARPGHRTDHATRASVCTRAAILTQSSSESHHPHGREI